MLNSIKKCRNNTVTLASSEENTTPDLQSSPTPWSARRNKFWLSQNLTETETTAKKQLAATDRGQPQNQKVTEDRHLQVVRFPTAWNTCSFHWPGEEFSTWRRREVISVQTNPDPKIRSTPDKTGTRHYFANRGSLKPPKHWMTQIWIGLCIYFLQCCIKKFSDRAPLVNFARQEQGCRATTPQQPVLQSIPQALHIPNFPPLEGYALIHGGFLLLQDNLLWKKEKH